MRKDNPFYLNKISKTTCSEVLESITELNNPLERALWALETPYLLPQNFPSKEPEGLFDSIIEGKPLVDIPHCQALVAFFNNDYNKAKEILENAPSDPYTQYNLILTLEALGDRETPLKYWEDKLEEEILWPDRLAIYEHLRTSFAAHEKVKEDIKTRFTDSSPIIMKKLLAHLAMHKDFELAEKLWMKGAIAYEELEDYGVDLALASGKLSIAISRLRNLENPKEKEAYVADFIKIVALKAIEDNDFESALELIETLLAEFSLSEKELLLYLRLKCACSLHVLERNVLVNNLTDDEKQMLEKGLSVVLDELEQELPKIKSLAQKLQEATDGPEDEYKDYLKKLIASLD